MRIALLEMEIIESFPMEQFGIMIFQEREPQYE